MPINAHFIQAAKLLTPGACYSANLILPHVHDLAAITRGLEQIVPWKVLRVRTSGQSGGDILNVSVECAFPAVATQPKAAAIDAAIATAPLAARKAVFDAFRAAGGDDFAVASPTIGDILSELLGFRPLQLQLEPVGGFAGLRLRADGSR